MVFVGQTPTAQSAEPPAKSLLPPDRLAQSGCLPSHALEGVQTYPVPAGSGVVFEAAFNKDGSGEGLYPFITHSFADAEKGAVGMIQIGTPMQFATMTH